MPWYFFALIASIFLAASTLIEKKVLFNEHATEYSAVFALFNAVLSVPLLFFSDFSQLHWQSVLVIYFGSILGTASFLLIAKSTRHMEVSSSSPLLVLGPAVGAIFAYFFLKESLNSQQVLGLAALVAGAYILQSRDGLRRGMIEILQSKYLHYLGLALLLYGTGSVVDRIVLSRYGISSQLYIGLIHLFVAVNFMAVLVLFYDGVKGIKHGIKNAGVLIFIGSVLTVGHRYFYARAVSMTLVGLVLAIKRSSALWTTIIGGEFFHEKHLPRKIFACIVMIVGLFLVAVKL